MTGVWAGEDLHDTDPEPWERKGEDLSYILREGVLNKRNVHLFLQNS